jgi:hypothetical protein
MWVAGVRRRTTAGAFALEGVDRAALEGSDRVFDETRLVERVGMDRDLHLGGFGDAPAGVDGRWGGAPVFVELQAQRARPHLIEQRLLTTGVALAHEAQVHRERLCSLKHARDVRLAGGAGDGVGAGGRPGAAASHRRDARHQRFLDLLRADEVQPY